MLANQWRHSPPKEFLLGSSSAKAAITFAFFSIIAWVRTGPLCRAGLGGLEHSSSALEVWGGFLPGPLPARCVTLD